MSETSATLERMGFEPSLHARWYRDNALFERERQDLFFRDWVCVGRAEDLPAPGDHCVLDWLGESLLVLRHGDGGLRAFYNVCRHRGARLCPAGADGHGAGPRNGNGGGGGVLGGGVLGGKLIRCPYHAWTYDLDGRLVHAPHLADQPGFEPGEIALHPVAVATWGGFLFLNLSPDSATDFDAWVVGPAGRLSRYPLTDLRVGHAIDYPVRANWKVLSENYNECYHCGPVHPELCDVVPAFRERGGAGLDWERGVPHRAGANTFTASGDTTRRSFPGLNADERERHKGELLLPNLWLSLARDHVAAFLLFPRSAGHTDVRCLFLFDGEEMARESFDPSDAVDFWDAVNRQDWAVCESVQQGMGARVFDYGALSPLEDWSLDVRRYVTRGTGLDESGR